MNNLHINYSNNYAKLRTILKMEHKMILQIENFLLKEQKWGKNNNFYYIPNLEHHCCTVYKVSFFVSKKQQLLGYYCILQLKTLQAVIINKVEFLTYEHHSARFPQNMIRIPIRKEITLDSNLKLAAFPMRILNSW